MNPERVHQQDVASILAQLQKDLDKVRLKYENDPTKIDAMNSELDALISRADRDLRLKTQAIVRSRLERSDTIPINFSQYVTSDAILPPEESIRMMEPDPEPIQHISPSITPRRPKQPVVATPRSTSRTQKSEFSSRRVTTRTMTPRGETPVTTRPSTSINTGRKMQSKLDNSRIQKVSFSRVNPERERPKTVISKVRKRMIPSYTTSLPKANKHDPAAPPPEVSEYDVRKFGLQTLSETKAIKDNDVLGHFTGTVVVSKFQKDLAADYRNFQQNWVLDLPKAQEPEVVDSPVADVELPDNQGTGETAVSSDLYNFTLKNGKPVENAPDWERFKSRFHDLWEEITFLMETIYQICEEYGLREATINGMLLADYTKIDPDELTREKIKRVFVGIRLDRIKKRKYGFGFTGPQGTEKAATLIQATWRGFSARRYVRMIMRNNTAARVIQRKWRAMRMYRAFLDAIAKERKKKEVRFDGIQADSISYRIEQPHCVLHLIPTTSGMEIGRIHELRNPNATVILFVRQGLPDEIMDLIRKYAIDMKRLHIINAELKLPNTFCVEDLLASDSKGMYHIGKIVARAPVILIPSIVHPSILDISLYLNALVMSPSPYKRQMFDGRIAKRRILKNAGLKIFEATPEIFDYDTLTRELAGFAIGNLDVQQWILCRNDGEVAWVNATDIKLLEDLKSHRQMLTETDLEDPNFIRLMCQNVSNDLRKILHTKNGVDPSEFVKTFTLLGGTVEAAPLQTKSAPSIAVFVPPVGASEIVGSWDVLFTSAYEPFASIHPAFTVPKEKLRKSALKIASKCSSKRVLGTTVAKFYYAPRIYKSEMSDTEREVKMSLTATDLIVGDYEESLPQRFVESILHLKFDEESMTMGPGISTYVQRVVKFPRVIEYDELQKACIELQLPIEERLFFVPNFDNKSIYSMIAVDDTPERLIQFVYRVFVTLADDVFDLRRTPNADLFTYCSAIEYLKLQYDNQGELTSTFVSQKKDPGQIKRRVIFV